MKTKFFLVLVALQSLIFANIYAQNNGGVVSQSVKDFNKTIKSKDVVLIDVRTTGEYATGHLQGALNIDVNDPEFVTKVQKVAKNKSVAVYCRSGRRSKMGAAMLKGKVKSIYDLDSGIGSWIGEGMPVVK